MVSLVIGTGFGRSTCCQPGRVSFVKVAAASSWPVAVQRWPTCVPVLFACL